MIQDIINIAVEAGNIAKMSDRTVKKKADGSPVTTADIKTSEYIVSKLKKFGVPILSEEDIVEGTHDTFFIVDPIDGTKGFINKEPAWTVNIALIKQNVPVLGVIVIPETNTTYYAEQGKGAYCTSQMHVNKNNDVNKVACSKSHMHSVTKRMIDHLQATIVPSSSSIKGCLLAQGDVEAYVRVTPVYGWDIAAMHVIIEEAGGKITGLDGNIIKYECRPQLIEGFIASNMLTHDTLLQSYEINKRD